jgi:N-acyl-phosphatidylethanolamine-hydrolysing phospholipase D
VSDLFRNPWPHTQHGFLDALRWKCGLGEKEASAHPQAVQGAAWHAIDPRDLQPIPAAGWQVYWLGHASFLLMGSGLRILIDPVFSDYCAPFPFHFPGLKRRVPPPLALRDLPPIDLILLTHSHYDHCDLPTLRHFPRNTRIIVAEGHRSWLMERGFSNVIELPWWSSIKEGEIAITATPAQHFTARGFNDRNRGHWCGWCIEGGGKRLWHAGDSGYCAVFCEIGERLGPFDLSMIPIGAYAPRWFMKPMHMNPEEAVQAFLDTRSKQAMAMHWGTFALTDEPLGEPPLLLGESLKRCGIPQEKFLVAAVGDNWKVF